MAPKNIQARFRAPDWTPDVSEFMILWHGTTALAKDSIETTGIRRDVCAVDSDFGRGFYTTTLERQARLWAWDQFLRWRARYSRATGNQPVVLRFRVRRYSTLQPTRPLHRGLDTLAGLHFVRPAFDNEAYWSLVQHCRQSVADHEVRDHGRPEGGWYDVVSGPVAAFWEQRVAMTDADQLSFHTDVGVTILQDLVDRGKGRGRGRQGDPDYYRWDVVT